MEFSMTETTQSGATASSQAARAEDIFRRYPDISAEEAHEAVTFLKKGRHLDIGLVTGNTDLKPNIDAFRDAHARALGLGLVEIVAFTAFFGVMLTLLVWALAK